MILLYIFFFSLLFSLFYDYHILENEYFSTSSKSNCFLILSGIVVEPLMKLSIRNLLLSCSKLLIKPAMSPTGRTEISPFHSYSTEVNIFPSKHRLTIKKCPMISEFKTRTHVPSSNSLYTTKSQSYLLIRSTSCSVIYAYAFMKLKKQGSAEVYFPRNIRELSSSSFYLPFLSKASYVVLVGFLMYSSRPLRVRFVYFSRHLIGSFTYLKFS